MKAKEILESFGGEYKPNPLRLGKYRNPEHPETGQASADFDPKVHRLNFELADVIDELIEKGVPAKAVVVDPRELWASQDWLHTYGSGEDTFPEYSDLPVVLKVGDELNIADGHHRVSRALEQGKMVRVYLFDIDDLNRNDD